VDGKGMREQGRGEEGRVGWGWVEFICLMQLLKPTT